MSKTISKNELKELIREMVRKCMSEMPDEGYVDERTLTPAEEKKKEELVKALKPKYGKTPKTYAIATAKAKELAEDNMSLDTLEDVEGEVFPPRFGINGSSKYLAVIYKDGEVDENKYFNSEQEAKKWVDENCYGNISEKLEFTPKYDNSKFLTKKQRNLPDAIQKGIHDKKSEKDIEEIRGISHNAKRVQSGHGKENLPYHYPVTSNKL